MLPKQGAPEKGNARRVRVMLREWRSFVLTKHVRLEMGNASRVG